MKMSDRGSNSTSSSDESDTADKSAGHRGCNGAGGTKQRTFRIPSHSENVLQALNRQRSNGEFCDITVLVEHQRFTAHKCVLSSSSTYFKGLLSNDNDGVFLRHVTADSFRAILDFMYTSKLQLDSTAVHDVLAAAKFLQVKGVISICCRYLESQIRTLARDLDEHAPSGKNAQMISVDVDFFQNSPIYQQQQQQPPHINSYNPNQASYVPDVIMTSPRAPSIYTTDHNVAQPQVMQASPQPLSSYLQPTTTSVFPMAPAHNTEIPSHNGYIAPNRLSNINETPQFQQPTAYPESSVFIPEQHQPTHTINPQPPRQIPVWQPSQDFTQQSYFPYAARGGGARRSSLTNAPNPFSSPRDQLPLPPIMAKRAVPGIHLYSSQSTGGKGRRPHLQPRRKINHGAVSDTRSIKYTFPQPSTLPKSSTPKPPSGTRSQLGEKPTHDQVMLMSSARVAKVGRHRTGTPDTVFAVEAEDRYWDAMSTPRQ